MKTGTRQNLQKTILMAMLVAIAVVSVYFIRIPLIPAAAFLEYDIADVPVLIGTMLFGPAAGFVILLITSALQALTVSSASGVIGFIMHVIASSMLVVPAGILYKKMQNKKGMIIGLAIGTVLMTLIMIPLNIVLTGFFLVPGDISQGVHIVLGMLAPAIIPFNLIKGILNSVLTFFLFIPVSAIYKKLSKSV